MYTQWKCIAYKDRLHLQGDNSKLEVIVNSTFTLNKMQIQLRFL